MTFNYRQKGMTLFELLVVMVILAMVSALLVQGMGTALVTYERVQRSQQNSLEPELAYHWLRQTISGVQAELDTPRQFTGHATELNGYTHRPLVGLPGQVHPFGWRLTEDEQKRLWLWYRQPGLEWPVLSWPAGSRGRFIYRALNGAPVEQWPELPEGQRENDGRIPGALFMEITPPEGEQQRWYVQLPGRSFPRADYRDF